MHKKIITGALVAIAMAPAFVFAETTDTQTQIQTLLQQIQALQVQLKTLLASSTMNWKMGSTTNFMNAGQMGKFACITLSRNLKHGDQGEDVKKLQEMLMGDEQNGFNGTATGFFGPLTMKAMMKFQMRMGIASTTDGSVGPLTRGFFERSCGKGLNSQAVGQGKMQGDDMRMAIRGTVSANNTSSIVIQTNGGSITANISNTTMIKIFASTSTPPTAGTVADLTVGKTVTVQGKRVSDNTMDALNIGIGEFVPMMKMGDETREDHGGKPLIPMNIMQIFMGQGQGNGQGEHGNQGGVQNW